MTSTLLLPTSSIRGPDSGALSDKAGTILPRMTARPVCIDAWLLLTATRPISHHDAAKQNDSNIQLFNRVAKLRALPASEEIIEQGTVDAFCQAHEVPHEALDIVQDLSFPEFAAAAFVRLFLDIYNHGDGEGVYSGKERYERLKSRLYAAAARTGGLRALWGRLTADLQVSLHPMARDAEVFAFARLPRSVQTAALRAMLRDAGSIVAIARLWHDLKKVGNEEYAKKAGREGEVLGIDFRAVFDAATIPSQVGGVVKIETYEVSANSMRHVAVRAPGWLHLCGCLGFAEAEPGQGELPPGAEAVFVNGGNIRSGAKPPNDPFGKAVRIRQAFPLLDLLGGVADSFDLGPSRLRVASWLVCRENERALSDSPTAGNDLLKMSALDMADDVVETRQATDAGVGQMIRNFETLSDGAQIALRLSLAPFTPERTMGALACALETYLANHPHAGGQGARGFGDLKGEYLQSLPNAEAAAAAYENDLAERGDDLRGFLVDGTLGSGAKVVS